ncbi:hypothetical protein LFX25_01605 [Leptospira sp. FAT2]|uniref:hypothetical protein n=1 Tax=Leptospira sanjuanensis TaxID=2879643 RepID=UPI001EE831AC|nr:hypothetical protein [Leptospira sanjuanensis]MCG6191937.1 hypothetical protein [Leptospira sanjuanensis]
MGNRKAFLYFKIILHLFVILFFLHCTYSTERKYTYSKPYYPNQNYFNDEDPQIEEGERYWLLDGLGNIFGSLTKLVLWNRKMNSHSISYETKNYLKEYLKENNLVDVKVRFNQYAPLDDLIQLWRAQTVHPVLKYTVGLFNWLIGTVFPERIFAGLIGGDHYNPYSNTIKIYSDLPTVALHEGGHAKDFSIRKYKSLYSLAYSLIPFFGPLYPEARASDDAIRYLRKKCDEKNELLGYRTLYPAYSTYVVGQVLTFPYSIVSSIPGHTVGISTERIIKRKEIPECRLLEKSDYST